MWGFFSCTSFMACPPLRLLFCVFRFGLLSMGESIFFSSSSFNGVSELLSALKGGGGSPRGKVFGKSSPGKVSFSRRLKEAAFFRHDQMLSATSPPPSSSCCSDLSGRYCAFSDRTNSGDPFQFPCLLPLRKCFFSPSPQDFVSFSLLDRHFEGLLFPPSLRPAFAGVLLIFPPLFWVGFFFLDAAF